MPVFRVATGAILVALAASAPAIGGPAFHGNVCSLVTATQTIPLVGSRSHCASSPATQGPGSTMYVGTWVGAAGAARLQVTIAVYSNQGALQIARRNLAQGLPGGTPKKVTGIGSVAYTGTGAKSTGIHFAFGKYIGYLTLGKASATTSLETLAKAVVARL
jgi:hypothetical protein